MATLTNRHLLVSIRYRIGLCCLYREIIYIFLKVYKNSVWGLLQLIFACRPLSRFFCTFNLTDPGIEISGYPECQNQLAPWLRRGLLCQLHERDSLLTNFLVTSSRIEVPELPPSIEVVFTVFIQGYNE